MIGLLQYDMTLSDAARAYILLTIGDGLVAQLPALILSLATAIIVTRVTTSESYDQASKQLANPLAFYIAGGILTVMGLGHGMPNMIFLLLGGVALGLGFYLQRSLAATDAAMSAPGEAQSNQAASSEEDPNLLELGWMMPVRSMSLA